MPDIDLESCRTAALAMPDRTRQIRIALQWQRAMADPLRFAELFCWTLDVHHEAKPIRPFPFSAPHIPILTRLWQHRLPRLLSVRKSRQMYITWWGSMISLWSGLRPGNLIMLQSKKLEDAIGNEATGDGQLGRAKFLLHHIPKSVGLIEGRDYVITSARIVFPRWNSALQATPQGGDTMRAHTASGIWSDESHFQDQFSDAYASIMPCIRGGGWFLSTSTANLGAANDLHDDKST